MVIGNKPFRILERSKYPVVYQIKVHTDTPVIEVLYTEKPIRCLNEFVHGKPDLKNGYYEFNADVKESEFWKFLSHLNKSRMLSRYFDDGECLLCSIDEELQR